MRRTSGGVAGCVLLALRRECIAVFRLKREGSMAFAFHELVYKLSCPCDGNQLPGV